MERLEKFWSILSADRNRLRYTILILLNHFAIGISINIFSACLVDLSFIYGVSLDEITYLSTSLGIGYIIGALAGFTYRYVNRQLLLGVTLSILSCSVTLTPRCGTFGVAITASFFIGLGFGSWNCSQTSWIIELWPEYSAIGLQGTELLFGLGGIVGPLLASPFVYGKNSEVKISQRIRSLTIPFVINGIIQSIVPLLLLWFYFTYPYKKRRREQQNELPNVDDIPVSEKLVPNRFAKLALGSFCLGTYVAAESSYSGFSSTMFQQIGIKLPANEAAIVTSMLLTTFTLGRCITALIGNRLKPDTILLYHFMIIFVSLFGIYLGQSSRTFIYLFSLLLGFGFSAMTATIMSFSQYHFRLSDRVCSIYAFCAGLFVVAVPLILAQSFERHPEVLFLIQACFLSACFLLFCAMKLWIFFDNKQ